MDRVPRIHMTGPLAAYQDALWGELFERGYALSSAFRVMHVAAHLSRWLRDTHQTASALSPAGVEQYFRYRRRCGYRWLITPKSLAPLMERLRTLGAVAPPEPAPVESSAEGQLLRDFETHLLEERGFQARGATGYCRLVRPFLNEVRMSDLSELEHISPQAVSGFILREARSSSVAHLRVKVTALRAFLRYLHIGGLCRDLSAAVPKVAGHRSSGLPRAIPQEAVRQIEESCDRGTAKGQRDHAILLLLSQLGLRSIEVAALELEDVRWAQGEILIRGKGSEGVLPLPQEVGAALVAYLKESRPRSTSRRIFLQIRAPHRDLTASGVRMVVGLACQRAGVPHIGSHKLRHTAATVMLRGGISLPDIAQVLRHRRVETTMIYAKVDDLALQGLARPWPGGEA